MDNLHAKEREEDLSLPGFHVVNGNRIFVQLAKGDARDKQPIVEYAKPCSQPPKVGGTGFVLSGANGAYGFFDFRGPGFVSVVQKVEDGRQRTKAFRFRNSS